MTYYENGAAFQYHAPGIHFQKSAPREQDGFKTGIPIFVGFGAFTCPRDSADLNIGATQLRRYTNWDKFYQGFRPCYPDSFLDYAVRGFFENGGAACWVVPLSGTDIEGHDPAGALEQLFEPLVGPIEDLEEADLVCVPDIMTAYRHSSPGKVRQLQQRVLEHCRHKGDRFALLDSEPIEPKRPANGRSPEPLLEKQAVRMALVRRNKLTYATDSTPPSMSSAFPSQGKPVQQPIEGALYFPWICVPPLPRHNQRQVVCVPPCGHVAGIIARCDARYGVHKAPANEVMEGVVDVEIHVSEENHSALNRRGINCLKCLPGRGVRVWGARTLSEQPNRQFINVRRLLLSLVRWIEHNMQDLVFEPNGPALWARVKDRLGAYCYQLYLNGALKGHQPNEAYFIKCDAETNPPAVGAADRLICEVGLAPMVPAEFVIIRVAQNPAGASFF